MHDEHGCTSNDPTETGKLISEYLGDQFRSDVETSMSPLEGEHHPLPIPIQPKEVESSMKKLKYELPKYAADMLAQPIADIFNQALEEQQPLSIGHGVLILLQKPGKPRGPLSSLRPIVLLTALRKTLSLLVLNSYEKVDAFLAPGQSGFCRGQETADVVFGYRWLTV